MTSPIESVSPTPLQRWLQCLAALVALALGGAVLAHSAMNAHPRFLNLADSVDSQLAIAERRIFIFEGFPVEFPSWRNRVLVPYAMQAITAVTPASASQAYLLVRWATACAALAAFAWLVRCTTRANWWLAGAAALGFAYSLLPTFTHIYDIPSDFLDAAFFSLLIGLILQKRRAAFVSVMFVALLNRESAIFGVCAWWMVQAWPFERRNFIRESAFFLVAGVAGTALVAWVRLANGMVSSAVTSGIQPFTPVRMLQAHWDMLVDYARSPNYSNPLFFLGCYLLFVALVVVAWGRHLPAALRQLGWVAVGLYLLSLPYGNINELRINIPALVISTLLLSWIAFREARPPATK